MPVLGFPKSLPYITSPAMAVFCWKGFLARGCALHPHWHSGDSGAARNTLQFKHCSQIASLAFPVQEFSPRFFFCRKQENKTKQKTTSANRGHESFCFWARKRIPQRSLSVRRVQQLHRHSARFAPFQWRVHLHKAIKVQNGGEMFSACIHLANTHANESTWVRALNGKNFRDVHLNCSVVT